MDSWIFSTHANGRAVSPTAHVARRERRHVTYHDALLGLLTYRPSSTLAVSLPVLALSRPNPVPTGMAAR